MSVIEMRSDIRKWVEEVDEDFLSAVHAMMGTYVSKHRTAEDDAEEIIGYRVDTNEPILASEADDAFEAIVEDVKRGNYVEIEEMIKKKSAKW